MPNLPPIRLPQWSDWLLEEFFEDTSGEARSVTILPIDGGLFGRVLRRRRLDATDEAAKAAFVKSFPDRYVLLQWFSGREQPRGELFAFLILCCYAASDIADVANNDFRKRLQEIMGWDQSITDCAGLPDLWRKFGRYLESARRTRRLRPLILKKPAEYHRQIGHAVELSFPSRVDASKLRTRLNGAALDRSRPPTVIAWLQSVRASARFSRAFEYAFDEFRSAWMQGRRDMVDHRFWAGWLLVCKGESSGLLRRCPFEVVADGWGGYAIARAVDGLPAKLVDLVDTTECPSALKEDYRAKRPLFLREIDWGRWTWAGGGNAACRMAQAVLVPSQLRANGSRGNAAEKTVDGALGWSFSTAVEHTLAVAGHATSRSDELVDVWFSGSPLVEGARLARPSFPIQVLTTGPVSSLRVEGESADWVTVERAIPGTWSLAFREPTTGGIRLVLDTKTGSERVERDLSVTRAVVEPRFSSEPPRGLRRAEHPEEVRWAQFLLGSQPPDLMDNCDLPASAPSTNPVLLDVLEYLATRRGAIGMGALVELLDGVLDGTTVGTWDVIRCLVEGGALDPFKTDGWRGRAVLTVPPSVVLARTTAGWCMVSHGLLHETLRVRLENAARADGLAVGYSSTASPWSVPRLCIQGEVVEALLALAQAFELVTHGLGSALNTLLPLSRWSPDGDGRNHTRKLPLSSNISSLWAPAGVKVTRCEREQGDAQNLWLVQAPDEPSRYWTERNLALLDACRVAGIRAFDIRPPRLSLLVPGAYLPLPLARWLSLMAGENPGPVANGYDYPLAASALDLLRRLMGPLMAPVPERDQDQRSFSPFYLAGRPAIAIATSNGRRIGGVWRWARQRN
ncbi:hypothetical protein ACFQS7_26565 [Dankookia sp. GCM10030260]|uniref:hypothetical protein n=1 Tax=Dankookia sp. GCM10030260 TaxID=3273390 RepID=UPI00361B0EC4